MDSNVEKILIELAQSGDRQAFETLFTFYRPRLFRVVNYILNEEADAEDVVQDVLVKLYRMLGSFRGQSSFFTWLYKIAVNAARTSLAVKARTTYIMGDDANDAIEQSYSSESDQPEVMHDRAELARMLNDEIAGLPPALREAFLLRELDGLSYTEIAELTHSPVGTVKSRISRAKSYLSEHISEHKDEMTFFYSNYGMDRNSGNRSDRA